MIQAGVDVLQVVLVHRAVALVLQALLLPVLLLMEPDVAVGVPALMEPPEVPEAGPQQGLVHAMEQELSGLA